MVPSWGRLLASTTSSPWPVRNRATQQEVSSRWASGASSVFAAAPHHSPSLPITELCLLLDQRQHWIILGTWTLLWTVHVRDLSRLPAPYENRPETIPHPPVRGKIVFHDICSRCQNGWGPLLYLLYVLCLYTVGPNLSGTRDQFHGRQNLQRDKKLTIRGIYIYSRSKIQWLKR